MSAVNRADKFTKIHKVLKKCYKPVALTSSRSVIEHMLFACCLEDAHYDVAEEAFAALVHTFFDWNEVRVTSVSELSEVMAALPDPRAAANRVKRVLHSVFEATFNFDLEECKKKNLGPTVQWLEKLDGATRFVVSYVAQAALDGHSIPLDAGAMNVLRIVDAVSEKDATAGIAPGLERAVPKSKGVEFGSLLHEFATDFSANPYSAAARDVLLQIDPDCSARLPKRRAARAVKPEEAEPAPKASEKTKAGKEKESEKTPAKAAEKMPSVKKTSASVSPVESTKKKSPPAHELKHSELKHPLKNKLAARVAAVKKASAEGLPKRKPR